MKSDAIDESIKSSCKAVIDAVKDDSVVDSYIALKTSKEGLFSFMPIHRKISIRKDYEKPPAKAFEEYLSKMSLYWGEHYKSFMSQLRQDLIEYSQSEGDAMRKNLAKEYISKINAILDKDIIVPEVDITVWFVDYFKKRLEGIFREFEDMYRHNTIEPEPVSIDELIASLKNGRLTPHSNLKIKGKLGNRKSIANQI